MAMAAGTAAVSGGVRRNLSAEVALAEAVTRYTDANPASRRRFAAACAHLPGGNTRSILHFSPFPLGIAKGEGAWLQDLDGHRYRDFLGEYTAGLYGHSHPALIEAIRGALADGITLGGPNRHEARLAELLCERFPSLDLVRFCNSGTEANLNALLAARVVTGRPAILVFEGAYHGGCFTYGVPPGAMNAPFPVVIGQYNDVDGTAALLARHGPELAAVILEPMMGAGGAIPGEPDFLAMLRERTAHHGIVLIFDEVMTSRLSPGGLQLKRGIVPDMTTFGKYLGGGLSFGAFGGAARIMERFDPRRPDHLGHSGTYNNNVLTMAAGVAGLEQAFTPAAALALNARGDALRDRLNAVLDRHGVGLQVLGEGSILCVHSHRAPVRRPADVRHDPTRQALFHLELLARGIYLARRGFVTLALPQDAADDDAFVAGRGPLRRARPGAAGLSRGRPQAAAGGRAISIA
jgi:glutamate-1-semialdehyde 2,1-aminomutase